MVQKASPYDYGNYKTTTPKSEVTVPIAFGKKGKETKLTVEVEAGVNADSLYPLLQAQAAGFKEVIDAIQKIPAPVVDVTTPSVNIPEIELPDIVIPIPEVTVEVPSVNIPPITMPEYKMPEPPKRIRITNIMRTSEGLIQSLEMVISR